MSHSRRRHSEIVTILNAAFTCLIALSILCLSMGTASASSSGSQSVLGWISNALGLLAAGDELVVNGSPVENGSSIVNASPEPADITVTPVPAGTSTSNAEPVHTMDMSWVYGTPAPTSSGADNNTTLITPASANETANTTNMTSTNALYNLTAGNDSSVIPDTASGQQGGPFDNWLALTIITIPVILAALIVVVQFVRKTE